MVTPFDAEGRTAEDEAVRLMRHLVDHGSDGLVLAGTTGESPTLDDEEKLRLWALGVEQLAGHATVVAGSGSNDTAHSVRLTERATEVGVDAVLVVTPYYNKPNRRGLLAHFRAVAGATDRPVIVYNIPSRSVIDLPNDLLRELAEIPNIQAVKQARSERLEPIEGMDLLAGNDEMLADVLDMGGPGHPRGLSPRGRGDAEHDRGARPPPRARGFHRGRRASPQQRRPGARDRQGRVEPARPPARNAAAAARARLRRGGRHDSRRARASWPPERGLRSRPEPVGRPRAREACR
jgi:Dihydrodipicolinate synthase/N-acetylneuraminate lyase